MEQKRAAPSTFGTLLRRYRLAAGLSQEALAERARMSVEGISVLERGHRRHPYRETIGLLAKALDLAPAATAQLEAAAARSREPRPDEGGQGEPADGHRDATNLPLKRTSLIGRETEIDEIAGMLRDSRLVTITGAGGVGKTRTALGVGEALLGKTKAGVWLVELAPVQRASLTSAVAQVLSVKESAARPLLAIVLAHLKPKSLVLILDNCEHVINEAAALADALLCECPHLRILATSREPLRISGEHIYRLPSLRVPVPQEVNRLSAATASEYAAVALFTQRAQALDPGFVLTDNITPIVAEICRRVDGIPLAIELAASRMRYLSPAQLRERLNERFSILTGGNRDALPRQQTLRGLIDWSYDLLDERECRLFRRLGIFVSGFTCEGAVVVGRSDAQEDLDIFDVLASLVDKSLVITETKGDAVRYRLLESPRAYALDKLVAANERDLLATRHLRFFRDRFVALRKHVEETGLEVDLANVLASELDDVRVALDRAPALSEVVAGGELLAAIGLAWRYVGLEGEGITRCETYLAALPNSEFGVLARILTALSLMVAPQMCGLAFARRAVGEARASGQDTILTAALVEYAASASVMGRFDEAEKAFTEAEAIPNRSVLLRLRLLFNRGQFNWLRGNYDEAASTFEQLRYENRSLGNAPWANVAALALAGVSHSCGKTHEAIAIVYEALPEMRSSADVSVIASALLCVAAYHAEAGDIVDAEAAAREAIGLNATHAPDALEVVVGIELLALVYALEGNLALAASLEGYAGAVLQRHRYKREPTEAKTHDRLAKILEAHFTPDELCRLIAGGVAMTPHQAVEHALAFEKSTH